MNIFESKLQKIRDDWGLLKEYPEVPGGPGGPAEPPAAPEPRGVPSPESITSNIADTLEAGMGGRGEWLGIDERGDEFLFYKVALEGDELVVTVTAGDEDVEPPTYGYYEYRAKFTGPRLVEEPAPEEPSI